MTYTSLFVAIAVGWVVPYAIWFLAPIVRRSKVLHGSVAALLVPLVNLLILYTLKSLSLISVESIPLWPMAMFSSTTSIGVIIAVVVRLHMQKEAS